LSVVGDQMLDSKNYYDFKKKNKVFILGVSDSNCVECCQDEPLLAFLTKSFEEKTYGLKKKPIPIVRIDTSVKHDFIIREGLEFNEVPKIYVGFDGKLY